MGLWNKGQKIYMHDKNFGLSLTFTITNSSIEKNDIIKMTFYKNNSLVLTKTLSDLEQTDEGYAFTLEFTESESSKFSEGEYTYNIDQYRGDILLNTLVKNEKFIVK